MTDPYHPSFEDTRRHQGTRSARRPKPWLGESPPPSRSGGGAGGGGRPDGGGDRSALLQQPRQRRPFVRGDYREGQQIDVDVLRREGSGEAHNGRAQLG